MEMATAVVGLVGVGAQISLLLGQFISGCANAPALVRTVDLEVSDFNSILSLLQPLILGSSPLSLSRGSMVYVDQLALTLTGCVRTLSEMEKEVNGLKPSGKMSVWDRLKWSRMGSTIFQLSYRLLSHKSSLSLILTILTSSSLTEATNCSVKLCEQLVEVIPHVPSPSQSGVLGSTQAISGDHTTNTDSSSTAGLDMDPTMSDSVVDSLDLDVDGLDLDVDNSESIMIVTRAVNSYRLTCESVLFTTRPYRRRSNDSVISLANSQRPKRSWSLISGGSNRSVVSLPVPNYEFSGLSLAAVSDIPTLPLPISVGNLHNSKWYGRNITSSALPRPLSTGNRGGLLRLFASRNKTLPMSLHHAAKLGLITLIQQLLEHGADMEVKDKRGDAGLHVAARNNHVSAVELLLDRGADVAAKTWNGSTALHNASLNGHDSTVGLLLDRGADVEAKAQNGFTPLHSALWNDYDSTVGLLLDRGADVEAKRQHGETPLHNASLNGHDSTVRLLLDHGADTEVKSQDEETPLHSASWYGHHSTVELLLDRGADVQVKNQDGETPLHNASRNGHKSIVQLLLDWGANKQAKSQCGKTSLDLARLGGYLLLYQLVQEDIL